METAGTLSPEGAEIYYELPEDDPDVPYPPPTFIDFASGDLSQRFPPTRLLPSTFHCQWLGGRHDRYPLATTLKEYIELRQSGSALDTRDHAALTQSQLTFGLLEAVLCIKIPETFLLCQAADGTATLSTAKLTVLCRDWYHRFRARHHQDKSRSWVEHVWVTLSDASRRLWAYRLDPSTNLFLAADLPQEAFENILRVSCMIGDSLVNVLLQSQFHSNPTILTLRFHLLPDRKHALDQLRAQGWCPLTIAALGARSFVIPEYAQSFPPFLRHAGEHDRCTDAACTVNNIDTTTYIQRHNRDECRCTFAIPPLYRMETLLSNGRIPVVAPSDEKLSVVAAEDVSYVAISHVWIDGLGSTTEDGLPACQVARIASMVSSLNPGGAFWIDALCVPNKKNLRKQAIQLMAKTYSEAAAVLVIDAGIRSCSKHAPLEEKLLCIYTSGWMQRLWTYQEAMLARRLCFEFRDGLIDLEDLVPSDEQSIINPLLHYLSTTLQRIRRYILEGASAKHSLKIGKVALAVRWRTTSRIEDETLAIAGLLHIDVHELLDASSPDERMKSLLLQKRTVSPDIVFATAPKISNIPGFSWAPRSFMTGSHLGSWVGEESAISTPTGLLAEYAFLMFSEPVQLDEDTWYVIDDIAQPACSFLLRPIGLVRDRRRAFCNAILIEGSISTDIGSRWRCVGVRMVDDEGTPIEREQVCRYQAVHFLLEVIEASEIIRQLANGTPMVAAKWCPKMKVKVE